MQASQSIRVPDRRQVCPEIIHTRGLDVAHKDFRFRDRAVPQFLVCRPDGSAAKKTAESTDCFATSSAVFDRLMACALLAI